LYLSGTTLRPSLFVIHSKTAGNASNSVRHVVLNVEIVFEGSRRLVSPVNSFDQVV
jgi:hypothetical protein